MREHDQEDHDAKLAQLASQLPNKSLSSLSKALKKQQGSVSKALQSLKSASSSHAQGIGNSTDSDKNRTGLDAWMNGSSVASTSQSQAQSSSKKRKTGDDTHQVVNLISDDESDSDLSKTDAQSPPKAKQPALIPPDPSKPTINQVLRPQKQEQSASKPSGPPPLLLGTRELVAQHSPCTLILNVLPSELAMACYTELLKESTSWQKNRWNLFDRDVVSPHTTRFYYDPEAPHLENAGGYWYNEPVANAPKPFTSAFAQVRNHINPVVNEHISSRPRLPFEWAGTWNANVAAANCYSNSKESVGFHSDRLNYLGPQTTICSLSLGVTRIFRLRSQGENARTLDIQLPHNSLLLMHAGCQEGFKHSVPPQRTIDLFRPRLSEPDAKALHKAAGPDGRTGFTERINVTFRFYRPDFTPDPNTQYPPLPRCKCEGQPLCILRPDMKGRLSPDASTPYFWQCGGAGTSCGHFQVLDMTGRGPCVGTQLGSTAVSSCQG